jgi:hypothetical protein
MSEARNYREVKKVQHIADLKDRVVWICEMRILTPPNSRHIARILLKSSIERIITTQPRSQRILNRLQHPFIVTRHHLHKLRHHLIPICQNCDRFLTLGILGMFLDRTPQLPNLFRIAKSFQAHHLGIAARRKITLLVENISNTATHPRREIASSGAEDDDLSACHVFTATIADRFYHCIYTRVTNAEPFACHAVDVDFAAGGSVESDVADDDVFGGDESGFGRGIEDDFTAAESFADVVVGIAFEFECDSFGDKCAEALSGTTLEFQVDGIFRESVPVFFGDFVTQDGTDGAVDVADREGGFGWFTVLVGGASPVENRVFAQV